MKRGVASRGAAGVGRCCGKEVVRLCFCFVALTAHGDFAACTPSVVTHLSSGTRDLALQELYGQPQICGALEMLLGNVTYPIVALLGAAGLPMSREGMRVRITGCGMIAVGFESGASWC